MMGMPDGLAFSDLDGRSDLSFRIPVGSWFGSARIVLPYKASSIGSATRSISVLSRNQVLGQFLVTGNGTINVDLPKSAFVQDIATISLVYTGGATPNRCLDKRVTADRLVLLPQGGLVVEPVPGMAPPVGAVVTLIGDRPTIVMPRTLITDQAAAILTIFAARSGARLLPPGATNGSIEMLGPDAPALKSLGPVQLGIGGSDPAGAARAAFTGAAMLPTSTVIDRIAASRPRPVDLNLADLGANSQTVRVGHEYEWTVPLPASRLPGGANIGGLSIDVATLPGDSKTKVSAWLNGTMLKAVSPGANGIAQINVTTPPGLTNALNWVTIRLDRDVQDTCDSPIHEMPAQLLPSSRVILGKPGHGDDFHNFSSAANAGVTVALENASALPFAAKATSSLISADVPITVTFAKMPANGPVIWVSRQPPPGTKLPMNLADGRMRVTQDKSGLRFDMPQSRDDTIVQLGVRGDGSAVLWVRPAASGSVPVTMYLSQGDIAIVSPTGDVQALSTERPRLAVASSLEPPSWWDSNKAWVFLTVGLFTALALTIWARRPSRKRLKPGQSA